MFEDLIEVLSAFSSLIYDEVMTMVCLVIAAIILLCSLIVFLVLRLAPVTSLHRKIRITQKKWYVGIPIAGIWIAGIIAYLPLHATVSLFSQIISSGLDSAKMFVLESTYLDVFDQVTEILGSNSLLGEIVFGVLFVAAPLCTAVFIITILSDVLKYLILRLPIPKDKYIFSSLNEKTLKLAKTMKGVTNTDDSEDMKGIRTKNPRKNGLYIFCNASKHKKATDPYFSNLCDEAKKYNFITLDHSILDIQPSKKKEAYYFVMSENSSENLDVTLKLMGFYSANKQVKIFVTSSEIEDESLLDRKIEKLSENGDSGFKVYLQHINESKMIAYNLLQKNPLFNAIQGTNNSISMLIIGGGSYAGLEVLKNSLWCNQWCSKNPDFAFHATVVDADIKKSEGMFTSSCPALDKEKYHLTFHQENIYAETDKLLDFVIQNNRNSKKIFNYIVISTDNDEINTKAALDLQAYYLREGLPAVISVVVRDFQKYELMDNNIARYGASNTDNVFLFPFGCSVPMYEKNLIVDSKLEKTGMYINAVYHMIKKYYLENPESSLNAPLSEKIPVMEAVIDSYNEEEARELWIKASLRDRESSRAAGLCASYIPWLCDYKSCGTGEEGRLELSYEDLVKFAKIKRFEWNTYQLTNGNYPFISKEFPWEPAEYTRIINYYKNRDEEREKQLHINSSIVDWETQHELDKILKTHNEDIDICLILALTKIIRITVDQNGTRNPVFDFSGLNQ